MDIPAYDNYKKMSEIERKELLKNAIDTDKINQIKKEELNSKFSQLKKAMIDMPINQNAKKYIQNIHLNHPWTTDEQRIKSLESQLQKDVEIVNKIESEKERVNNELLLRQKAILYCQNNGWKLSETPSKENKEFILSQELEIADEIKYQELIAEKIKDGMLHDFSGEDNCEDCNGWDGVSRRCQCGNRRVGWVAEGNFDAMYIYGEAW